MAEYDTKLEELKQRSHDYALWYINSIFGTLALLLMFCGVGAVVIAVALSRSNAFYFGFTCIVASSVLHVLLSILHVLKDIRTNTRELFGTPPSESPEESSAGAGSPSQRSPPETTTAG